MVGDYDPYREEPKRSRFVSTLVMVAVAFVAGLIAMGYLLTNWGTAADFLRRPAAVLSPQPEAPPAPPATRAVALPVEAPVLAARIDALDERIARIEARASAASGNASRAESLLVAVAARRALDGGGQLGYIEALLRDRFGRSHPQAVATIISAGRQPVTLLDLQAGLTRLAPALTGPSDDASWWDGVRRELSALVVVRRADTPSPNPVDRLARAHDALEAGRVDAALAEVARLPARAAAADWMAAARRYVLARTALDRIESAALLQSRRLDVPPTDEPDGEPAATTADRP
jgi:hypothetical protein